MQKSVGKSIRRFKLIADDDTILVAVSGGKDSMALLDLLHRRQRSSRERYRLVAGHVSSDRDCGIAVAAEWLRDWCDEHGIPFVSRHVPVAAELEAFEDSKCFRCSWLRRKALFTMADEVGANKLAFGHNADDIAETTLMNLFYSGRIYTMEPKLDLFHGKLTVIRPLALTEERNIVPYANAAQYPLAGQKCIYGEDSRRAVVKGIIREIERTDHKVKRSIFAAVDRQQRALKRAGISDD